MNENHAPMVLSDEVKIEIIHSSKEVLIRLIDTLFPRNTHTDAEQCEAPCYRR